MACRKLHLLKLSNVFSISYVFLRTHICLAIYFNFHYVYFICLDIYFIRAFWLTFMPGLLTHLISTNLHM